jgi:hypothetical protein
MTVALPRATAAPVMVFLRFMGANVSCSHPLHQAA